MTLGELLTLHPPAVVRRFTLPEARAVLRAVYQERDRQARLQIECVKAMMGAMVGG